MPLSIEVRGLDGVSLLSPADPEFDTLAAPLLGRATELVLQLKPFLVLVQNESARTVVAFSKTLRITHAGGRMGTLQDQAIFDDGTMLGADESLLSQFSDYLEAKQHWYRSILAALDAGQSIDDAFGPVGQFRADERKRRDQIPRAPLGPIWKGQAAADAERWRRRHAEREVHRLLKETIRLEPFVIRRRS